MTGIRINELARELEVPSRAVIELLSEFGVDEKKTHSSSIEPDVAEKVRARLTGGARPSAPPSLPFIPTTPRPAPVAPPLAAPPQAERPVAPPSLPLPVASPVPSIPVPATPAPSIPVPPAPAVMRAPAQPPAPEVPAPPAPVMEVRREPAKPEPARPEPARPEIRAEAKPDAPKPDLKTEPAARPAVPSIPVPPRSTAAPVRPPLSGAPAIPIPKPPVARPPAPPAPPRAAMPQPPAAPAPPRAATPPPAPAVPATPAAPAPPRAAAPTAPAAVTLPGAPRPGQILNRPSPSAIPQIPKPPGATPGAPSPRPAPSAVVAPQIPRPPSRQQGGPGGPGGPGGGGPLAGQPTARPIVPPRPDLVARLQQQQQPQPPRSAPGAPMARPQRPGGPTPGQPIHRGPLQPGRPMMGRPPGGPFPGSPQGRGPGGPGGGPGGYARRPMHPTSPMRPGEAPLVPPTDGAPGTTRRHATKPGARKPLIQEQQEGKLQYRQRRDEQIVAPNKEITISEGITVKELAEKLGLKGAVLVKKLFDLKMFATINQSLDIKMAEDLARAFGSTATQMSYEEESTWEVEMAEDTADRMTRPPVVTIMGHVDHGKTSLLDKIRTANVAAREAGGITQHIGAYQVESKGQKITFIDTPGHEAFTRMRARGAKVTDIVILVVAADDGVMPQTVEAIDHAKAAKVPIIVAINKIDKPDAQLDRIKQQLNDRGLLATDWGGDVEMLPVSAKTGQGIDTLLETILLVAEMGTLRANPGRPAIGNVLEAQLDRGRGPVATVLVQNGTLKVGDYFICGSVFGRVRALYDAQGDQVREAEPSKPVEVLGLESLPEVGDTLQVVTDTAKAKQIVGFRETQEREIEMAKRKRVSLEQFHKHMAAGEDKELNIIIKADVGGSAEVLADTLLKLSNAKVAIRIISKGVGAITERDVLLATASDAIIIGFNVRPEKSATNLAEKEGIDIRMHTIIYEMVDEMKKAMVGLLEPVFKENAQGRAEVREVFRITKVGTVAGVFITEGFVTRNSEVRVLRDNVVLHTGKLDSLKRFKNDASEVKQGFECGLSVYNFQDLRPGDIIEAFVMEKVAQTFA